MYLWSAYNSVTALTKTEIIEEKEDRPILLYLPMDSWRNWHCSLYTPEPYLAIASVVETSIGRVQQHLSRSMSPADLLLLNKYAHFNHHCATGRLYYKLGQVRHEKPSTKIMQPDSLLTFAVYEWITYLLTYFFSCWSRHRPVA